MATEWTEFRTYLYGSGLMLRKGEKKLGRVQSHFLLDGGIVVCPPDRIPEFHKKYAEALFKGTRVYCVEQKTKDAVYMLSEFDLKIADREINSEELRDFVRIVQGVMSRAFTRENVSVAVLTAPPKVLRDFPPSTLLPLSFE